MNDDVLKLYNSLQKYGYNNLGTSDEFGAKVQDSTSRRKLYDSLTRDGFNNLGTFDEFSGRLVTNQQADQQKAPRKALNVSLNPATEQAYKETMAPKQAAPAEQPQQQSTVAYRQTTGEEPERVNLKKTDAATVFGGQPEEQEVNPFPYSGGLEEKLEEIAKLRETVAEDKAFVEEYEKRRAKSSGKNAIKMGAGGFSSYRSSDDDNWLKENAAKYKQAKANVAKVEKVASPTENAIGKAETDIARRENRAEMPSPAEVIATGRTPFGGDNAGRQDPEYQLRKYADELYASADKEYNKSSKYQEGYEGDFWDQLWTGVKDFGRDAANNIDSGSFTFGLSKGLAGVKAREVGDKYNSVINGALKDMGLSEDGVKSILSSLEESVPKLEALEQELTTASAEIDTMSDTYEDMARRGDPNAESYGRQLQKKIDAYNKRVNDEYKPTYEAYDKNRQAYEDVMAGINAAIESGLTGGEKALLDALEKFTQAKTLRSDDVSVGGKAGAGAEQSAEFMLDFILTGGISKAGTKVATKIATNRALKKFGADALKDLAKVGKTVKPGLGLRLGTDVVTTLAREGVMAPRTIQAYSDNLTEYNGKDEAGRYDWDRSQANALANSLLTQYIEYWSEGFGEYFGEAEQALFRSVTKNAPKEVIGKTLKGYRGSIGQYLDKGKFDGMFNEMLEEVVGSTFNAIAGWMSKDRVGDKDAMKEFFAGENLATLALSFLPMSAIGAATNLSAYHKMKERYDKGAAMLDGYIRDGAVDREELKRLTDKLPELTTEEAIKKMEAIADKAREKNGEQLPSDFMQNLLGYVEGEFAMNLRYDEWEDSQEKMAVVNSYMDYYANPDPRAAWDLNDNEATTKQAALDAGFTEEELDDKDAYLLAQDAFEMKGTQPERAGILMNYAEAKGAVNGLQKGYAAATEQISEAYGEGMRSKVSTDGVITTAKMMMNGRPVTVFITQEDAGVDTTNGTLTTPTGPDGEVKYRLSWQLPERTAKANTFSEAQRSEADAYISEKQEQYRQERAQEWEAAQNTVSPTGQAKAISEKVGYSVIVRDGQGVFEPVIAERMTTDEYGQPAVVLSGDKKALQGIAGAMGIRIPTTGYLEAPVSRLYPLLAKEEDGSLSSGLGEKPKQETKTAAQAPAVEQAVGIGDLRDQTVQISVGDRVQDAHVISTDDGKVMFELLDSNGDVTRTAQLPEAEFAQAMQKAQAPAEETVEETPAPAAQEEEVVPKESTIPVDEKTGEKIYSAPGVEVADAIADLYATEGLTEADVDQYIAEEAAKAEAARNPERGNMSPQAWGQAKKEAARVADFWAEMQRAAQQRKAQQEAAIEEAAEEATPAEMPAAEQKQAKPRTAPRLEDLIPESDDKIVSRLENWSKRTGVKVRIVNSIDEVSDTKAKDALKKGRRLTGWYLPETKEVEVYLPNMTNTLEADKTFIHEVVAHKGLRGLLGDKAYDELCDRVWSEMMTPEEQQEFLGYNEHLQGSEEFLHRAAADEFIARLSENLDMPDRRSIFEKIVDWIMDKLGWGRDTSDIEKGAAEKVAGMETISRFDLYDLLEESLKRFEKGRSKLYTESLPAPMQNEMAEKGLVLDGGAVMDEQQNALKQATGYETLNELDSKASPEVGDVRFSESTMPAWARNYMTYRDAKKHVVQVLENFARDVAVDEVVHGMVPTGVYKYGEKSSGSFAGPLRTNIEYIVTFDMDTSCPRSLQYLEYVRSIEAQIGRPLTQVESIQLIEMMRMYGQMIPCVYCYCENKRQALKQYYTDFMKARHGVINAKTEEEALAAMYGHQTMAEAQESTDPAVALTPAAYEVFKKWRQEKDYNPTMQQLWAQYRNDRNVILTILDDMLDKGTLATDMTDQKITNVLCKDLGITGTEAKGAVGDIVSEWKWDRIEDRPHNDFTRVENEDDLVLDNRTLALWREMTSYGKSASGAKNVLRYVPYTDELKTLSQEQRDYINGLGGLRMHSSNDFRIDYVLDYFQFMADMAVNKMLGHTYTKSPEFVRIFGNSGYKINMSVAAYEDSHGIRPNADEGFDWTTARELREQFPNAGVMLMATSDAQIQFALDNDWIDMCIPFHHSGLPKAVWYQMRRWSDYSSTQNEKFLNATEMREALKADGVPVSNKLTAAAVEKMYLDHFNIKVLRGKDGKRMRPHFLPGPTPKDGVIIPGHNNDYDTYIRLCREYGVHPRFYGIKVKDNTPEGKGREVDITEHPGYMKFIKETARTDSPQTPIEFNFDQPSEALDGRTPIEYALEELKAQAYKVAENTNDLVRNIYELYKEDKYGIVPQFINDIVRHKQEIGVSELPLDYLTPTSREWFMTERKALEDAYKDFDTIPYHPHEYDENGNLIMEGEPRPTEPTDEGGTRFREVTDQAKIDELEAGDKVTVYRSMQFVPDPKGDVEYDLGDGNGVQKGFLYAPMSAKVDGQWRNPIHLGRWEEAEERPDLANENGEFILDKGDGSGPMPVAYAPYLHTRRSPLNEQFSSAYNRPNLVIVRSEIPASELTSNYTAEKSKKSTGEHDWPSGKVSNYLAKKGKDTRKVILSRWAKPVEIVPIEQVADEITSLIGDENVAFPYNVVTPGLRAALMKRGVKFDGWQGNKPKNVDELIAGMKESVMQGQTMFREVIERIQAMPDNQPTLSDEERAEIEKTNSEFNQALADTNEENIEKKKFNLGRPGSILRGAGVADKEMILYGPKLKSKAKKHGFDYQDIKDLPRLINDPIAVFNNYKEDGNRSILTDIKVGEDNMLVSVNVGKGNDIDFNIIATITGKRGDGVVNWLKNKYDTYVNKKKTLDYLQLAAPITASTENSELSSDGKDTNNSETSKENRSIFYREGYHGSIADFDRFDRSHAGEGEGYNAHGFGHYIALNKDTGLGYAWSNAFDYADRNGLIDPEIAEILRNEDFEDYDSMVKRYDELLEKRKQEGENEKVQNYRPLSEVFEGMRNLYTVEIPEDNGENYIDEMKTLSKDGRRRIANVVRNLDEEQLDREHHGPNWLRGGFVALANVIEREQYAGLELRRRLEDALGNTTEARKMVSDIFRKAGFVGMKYDGRSDGPCVVIFDDNDLAIKNHTRFREAPNGKRSNLTDEQWEMVRTPEFKAWFGDWENDPANASKVIDENGEPRIVYHGGTFGKEDDEVRSWGLNPFVWDKESNAFFSENRQYAEGYNIGGEGTIDAFLNIRNPFEMGDTARWLVEDGKPTSVARDYAKRLRVSVDDIVGLIQDEYADEAYQDKDGSINVKDAKAYTINRNPKFAELLKEKGFDGAMDDEFGSRAYMTTEPNQIKSATDNNGEFNPNNPDIRFRERITPEQDKEYMDAVNSGDMEKAQRMVRDAFKAAFPDTKVVDENGEPRAVYHGTWEDAFNIFRPNEWLREENGDTRIRGYFSTDKSYAENYGPTRDFFLNIENPIEIPFYDKTLDEWKKWFEERGVKDVKFDSSIEEEPLNGADYGDGVRKFYPPELFDSPTGFYGDGNLTEMVERAGYDGFYYPGDESAYAAFRPSQIKSADPVTYDDNGDVIPLSERFNSENDDIRFRDATPVEGARNAQVGYEDEIRNKVTQFLLEWQDQDIPVRIAINQVMNEIGMEHLPEDSDYLTRHNLVSSRADAQMHNYKLFYFEPMMQTIGQIEDILVGGKPSVFDRLTGRRQKRMDAYNQIVDYCYAVSGLERNEWKRAEAKTQMEKELNRLAEKWEKESEAINADSRLSDSEKAESLDRAEKRYLKQRDEIEEKYADRDYSGITDLMGRSKAEWEEAEAEARAMIAEFQGKVGNNDLLNEMWDRIRACTDFNLEHAYKYGLLSRAEYEKLHGTESQPRMWEYYLPLRGFAERTAEDEYTYSMFTNDSSGGEVIKKAKGRTTKADDPFATMRHISELEIVQGLNNWAKQALYNFVLNAGENSLLTQVEPWYVKEPGSDNWTVAEPKSIENGDDKDETLEEFETRMQEAYDDGLARRGRNGLKLGHIMANPMHRNQHMIRLKINGAEKMIWVNGSPVLAQSVNGVKGWNSRILNGIRGLNRALSQFYTTYSLKFLTKNKLRDTQFSRIAAAVDEPQAYLRQLEKNWWANNGYVAFGYPMMKLVSEWESGELEKKENRTEREQMFIDFMYDGGATGYTMINSMDKIKRELERMVKNAGRGERNIPIIDWYAKGVSALNEASELLTRFTFYQTSRMMGRSRERSAYDAKESSVNFNRRGLRSGNGVSGWTSAAASALYLFMNPAIQGLDKFVRLHKAHPWRMGIVDATYFMMGFVNSLLNAMIAGASDGDGDDEEKMGPDWYWNIPEWVRRSNMIIGSPFKKLGKWGYLVIALPIEYKGFYAMGELASSLVQGKYAAKDAPTIANEVVGVVAELMPINPVEGYTPGDNPTMSILRNMAPDAIAPLVDVATNRTFAGIPLWKENIYDEHQPLSQSAFASTPEILNKAVIKLSEVTSTMPWHVDIPSGAIRGILKGYGGGAYTFVEDLGKFVFADDAHPRRYENIPFISGFTGYLEEDRRDSFNSDALQRYKELEGDLLERVRSAAPGVKITESILFNTPEDLPKNARVTMLLNSDKYILAKMYYDGMKAKSGAKETKVDKNGRNYTADVKDDVTSLRQAWKKAKEEYLELAKDKNASDADKDAAERKVQKAWLEYTQKEDSLVDRLMEEEYNHVRQKMQNGIPYEPKESLAEKAYKLTNKR